MKIKNVNVYDIIQSIKASGYPMSTEIDNEVDSGDLDRAEILAKSKQGSGHDCFLKGITISFDVTAPQYWWLQFQRYHFADIVSSQSKMHRITKMDIAEQCNEYVTDKAIDHLKMLLISYRADKSDYNFQRIIANTPMGLQLTARVTTNYLQLKSIYNQRRSHKLEEWQVFCDWIENLTYSEFITGGN